MPTPIEPMPRLTRALGGPTLYVKRDDCTGLAFGGNKVRKLEFLVGEAQAVGAEVIITTGGLQSNHARQTAAAAAKLGLLCDLVLVDLVSGMGDEYPVSGNVLIDDLVGARITRIVSAAEIDGTLEALAGEHRQAGRKPFVVPLGGSTPTGALGYVAAVEEILNQQDQSGIRIDHIVLASSSGGTCAGILAGLQAARADIPVTAVCVYEGGQRHRDRVMTLYNATLNRLEIEPAVAPCLHCHDAYLGPGYGLPTDAMRDAVRDTARHEGLILDPVYTGKAMAGLIDLARTGRLRPADNVLFLHTGGGPALFAYRSLFAR